MSNFIDLYSFDELRTAVIKDKEDLGIGVTTRNRYPLRFVLFDNFDDCFSFVEYLQQERGVTVKSVGSWLDLPDDDVMIDYHSLGTHIEMFVKSNRDKDCVIAPFSELARFYNNEDVKTFDSLIKTLKGIDLNTEHRYYIPIVGLEGKIETFRDDSQISVWHLHSEPTGNYRLVLLKDKNCYGINNLEHNYTVVNNLAEWLDLWRNQELHRDRVIICTSESIYANAVYAQPDNAFTYESPKNAFEFLRYGLQLDLGGLEYREKDKEYWPLLAEQIDASKGFSLQKFVSDYFGVMAIDTGKSFLSTWFRHNGAFDRWLLCSFYAIEQKHQGLLCRCIDRMADYSDRNLFTEIALEMNSVESEMRDRREYLDIASRHHVALTEEVVLQLGRRLENLPKQMTYQSALIYFTSLTNREKEIAITWVGQGNFSIGDVKPFYPDLYQYMQDVAAIPPDKQWVADYIAKYKQAKIANKYTEEIQQAINERNSNSMVFDTWFQSFKTTRTWLMSRSDIDVFYWIDGLGVDWIPFVQEIIKEHERENIYLNDVIVGRAVLPTTTSINKAELQKLTQIELQKVGDVDSMAHVSTNVYPAYIISEMETVRKTIEKIIQLYAGKKVAIISDHGMTYLSQLCPGMNIASLESDHHGRLATIHDGKPSSDDNYIVLDDGKTLCALKHESLCAKVPRGQGAHGGCTPEEVLVPIFIVSGSPNECSWKAVLLSDELSAANPKLCFKVTGLSSMDTPYVRYAGQNYKIKHIGDETFETETIQPMEGENYISVCVGSIEKIFPITLNLGVTTNDLFDF